MLDRTGPADAQARLDCIYSVWFNFLGRDFFNALSEKDTERFTQMLIKWLCSLFVGIPVSESTYFCDSCSAPRSYATAVKVSTYMK